MSETLEAVSTSRTMMIMERWRRPGLWYVVQRLAAAVVVIFAVVSATFLLAHAIPADPARAAAGLHAGAAQVAAVAQQLGLDRPLWDQYVSYIRGSAPRQSRHLLPQPRTNRPPAFFRTACHPRAGLL